MRAAAEIDEAVVLVERDPIAVGQALGELDLVRLALCAKRATASSRVVFDALEGVRPARQDRTHLVLDAGEVALAGRLRELEVVVEAVLDCGADRHLGARPEVLDGLGQDVRRGVP